MPIVSVTPLGSSSDGVGSAIGQIIDYLERGSRRPQPNTSLVGYYADTPTTARVWRGRGVNGYQLIGPVHTEMFRTVLEGNHPLTTETLVSAVGSSGRADPTRSPIAIAPTGEAGEALSTEQVAALLGVSERYVRKVAAEPGDPAASTKARLDGVRADGRSWDFRRDAVEGFAAGRSERKVVVAYDVTVSFELARLGPGNTRGTGHDRGCARRRHERSCRVSRGPRGRRPSWSWCGECRRGVGRHVVKSRYVGDTSCSVPTRHSVGGS